MHVSKEHVFMVYLTGDIHGMAQGIMHFCHRYALRENDTLILLGDVGANFHGSPMDDKLKRELSSLPKKKKGSSTEAQKPPTPIAETTVGAPTAELTANGKCVINIPTGRKL